MKQGSSYTNLHPVHAVVPQGSVLEPTLYMLHTANLLAARIITVATYADDSDILASHTDPKSASSNL